MKIYTRTGDEGSTGLFGGGRVLKTHPRIAAYGTVDELNSFIGLARSHASEHTERDRIEALLSRVQSELFVLGADLATPAESKAKTARIGDSEVRRLETDIDSLDDDLPPLKQFILPGGTPAASALHVARAVCRRAERLVLVAAEKEDISLSAPVYLNRLSDFLFVLARWVQLKGGGTERTWRPEL